MLVSLFLRVHWARHARLAGPVQSAGLGADVGAGAGAGGASRKGRGWLILRQLLARDVRLGWGRRKGVARRAKRRRKGAASTSSFKTRRLTCRGWARRWARARSSSDGRNACDSTHHGASSRHTRAAPGPAGRLPRTGEREREGPIGFEFSILQESRFTII